MALTTWRLNTPVSSCFVLDVTGEYVFATCQQREQFRIYGMQLGAYKVNIFEEELKPCYSLHFMGALNSL
jgi:hypothetical protein